MLNIYLPFCCHRAAADKNIVLDSVKIISVSRYLVASFQILGSY